MGWGAEGEYGANGVGRAGDGPRVTETPTLGEVGMLSRHSYGGGHARS